MSCLSDDEVTEFVEGTLAPDAATRVDRHMAECSACRGLVADLARVAFDDTERGPQPGDLVGRYRLKEIVGVGGMGVVYAGEDPELGRKIALKVIRTDLVTTSGVELQKRLHQEARAMAKISHPNVVGVHDIGTIGGHVFVAMEFVQGKTLREWLAISQRSWSEILDAFVAAGRGLAAAHAAGLVHRDFKPENVLYGDDGRVRVTDFGLARGELADRASTRSLDLVAAGSVPSLDSMTRTGHLAGTPAYMAPEQIHGAAVDARSDQFSFCVALFEALYGVTPFPAKDVKERAAKMELGELAPVPDATVVPAGIHPVLARGLRARPAERWPSVDALLEGLLAFRPGATLRASASAAAKVPRRSRSKAVVVTGGLLAAGAIAGAVWFTRRPVAPAPPKVASRPAASNECPFGPGRYCAGHGVEGTASTLYKCNEGRVTEEKKCAVACLYLIGNAIDACDVDTPKCPIGNGVYCGGNHLSADPDTLYRCIGGTVTVEQKCDKTCVKEPDRVRDHCL